MALTKVGINTLKDTAKTVLSESFAEPSAISGSVVSGVSGSVASTGSFGSIYVDKNVNASAFVGDGSSLTGIDIPTAADISGSIVGGVSGSAASTGSFGSIYVGKNVNASSFVGDGSALTGIDIPTAAAISGSHTSGFEYSGTISGSATSTGSFGSVHTAGNVGIGVAVPEATLHVITAGSNNINPNVHADDLVLENSVNVGMSILTPNDRIGRICFGDSDIDNAGFLSYDHNSDYLYHSSTDRQMFLTAGAERMRIESTGRVEIYTAVSGNSILHMVQSHASAPHGVNLDFSAASPDDETQWAYRFEDSTTLRFIVWSNGDVENHDNSYTGISDIKLKQNVEDARDYWDDFKQIRFRKFKFKSDVEAYGEDAEPRFGVVAQEVESVFPSLVTESPDQKTQDVAVLDEDGNPTYEQTEIDADGNTVNKLDSDGNPIPSTKRELVDLGTTSKGFKYSILSQIGLKVVQELQARCEALESKVTALENA
jgi:hypothetical protein